MEQLGSMEKNVSRYPCELVLWNQKDLKTPPCVSLQHSTSTVSSYLLGQSVGSLDKAINSVQKLDLQHTEESILNYFIHKSINNYRNENFFHFLQMIQNCMKQLTKIPILKIVRDCRNSLPRLNEGHVYKKTEYLPSRQSIEYILLHLQGYCALLGQTTNYCVQAYIHVYQQLRTGMFITNMLVVCAIVSRIRMLCMNTLQALCACYNALRKMLTLLQATPTVLLPQGTMLPEQLDTWLLEQGFSTKISASYDRSMKTSCESQSSVPAIFHDAAMREVDGRHQGLLRRRAPSLNATVSSLDTRLTQQQNTEMQESDYLHCKTNIDKRNFMNIGLTVGELRTLGCHTNGEDTGQEIRHSHKPLVVRRLISEKGDKKLVPILSRQDLLKMKRQLISCDSPQEILNFVQKSNLKVFYKTHDVKGFGRIKKCLKSVVRSSGKNLLHGKKELSEMKSIIKAFIDKLVSTQI